MCPKGKEEGGGGDVLFLPTYELYFNIKSVLRNPPEFSIIFQKSEGNVNSLPDYFIIPFMFRLKLYQDQNSSDITEIQGNNLSMCPCVVTMSPSMSINR